MAKIHGPLLSANAQGKYAGNVIFRDTKNGPVATRFHSPYSVNPGPPSAAQLAHRALYSAAVSAWRALTAPQQAAYDLLAGPENLSGWNYFLRETLVTPPTIITDDFTRADENPIASPWNAAPPWVPMRLQSNLCRSSETFDTNAVCVYDDVLNDDCYSEGTVGVVATLYDFGPVIRFQLSNNGYYFFPYSPDPGIFKVVSGGFTQLVSLSAMTINVGDKLRITAVGSTLEAFHNGVSVGSVVDTTYPSGRVGLGTYKPDGEWSAFEADNI